jgi:hypothetical protein
MKEKKIIEELKELYNKVIRQFQPAHDGIIASTSASQALSEQTAEELLKIIKKHE